MAQVRKITVQGEEYSAYADIGFCNTYLRPDLVRWQYWNGLDSTGNNPDIQNLHLIHATRVLDNLENNPGYLGERTSSDLSVQDTSWPRTGTGVEGVTDNQVPVAIEQATCLLAAAVANNPNIHSQTNVIPLSVKKWTKEKRSEEYFSHHSNINTEIKPVQDDDVLALIRQFLRAQQQGSFDFSTYSQPGQPAEFRPSTDGYFLRSNI